MNEFIVESKGHCFLCLKQISLDSVSHNGKTSIQYFARYLRLDTRKVFYEGGHDISPKLLEKVQKSKMKVELCEVCTELNYSFSVAYRQLEKIQLGMRSKLDLIHQRMLNNEEHETINNVLSEMLVRKCNSDEMEEELAAKLKITDVLRNETMEKCSHRLSMSRPRVKVERLTSAELLLIEKAKTKHEYNQLTNDSSPVLDTESLIKTEASPSNMDTTSVPDDDNFFTGYDSDESEYEPTHSIVKPEVEEKFSSNESKPNVKRKLSRKGKARQGRYKCTKCDKSYAQRCNLNCHQRTIHLGKKIQCDHCGREFNTRANYNRHVMTIHQGKKYSCKFCSKIFCQPYPRNIHMKEKCPKRKLNK